MSRHIGLAVDRSQSRVGAAGFEAGRRLAPRYLNEDAAALKTRDHAFYEPAQQPGTKESQQDSASRSPQRLEHPRDYKFAHRSNAVRKDNGDT